MLFPFYNCRRLEEGSGPAAAGVKALGLLHAISTLRCAAAHSQGLPPVAHPPKHLVLFLSVFLNAELPCCLDNHFGSCPQTPHRVFQPRAPLKYRLDSVYLLLLFIHFLSRLPLFCGADRLLSRKPCARKTDTQLVTRAASQSEKRVNRGSRVILKQLRQIQYIVAVYSLFRNNKRHLKRVKSEREPYQVLVQKHSAPQNQFHRFSEDMFSRRLFTS